MVVRAVEGKKPYTGGIAIEITEDKVINLRLRDENNLIQYDEGDNEIYVDLQLDDEIEPTDELPVGITTGRIIVDNQRDYTGTILVAKTTSGDLIKFVYADNGNIYIDNGTGTFKQIYLKADVDTLINALRVEIKNYVDAHDTVVSATAPIEPYKGQLWYDTANDELKSYDGTNWNIVGGSTYSAGTGIDITSDVISIDSTVVATQTDLLSKQDSLTASTGISIDSNNNISNTLPGATVNSTAPSNPSQGDQWYDTTNDVLKIYDGTQWNEVGGSSSGAAWGQITGTLSDQTDLQNALDAKQDILTAGNGITISSANITRSASTLNISVDTAVVATQTEMADKQDMLTAGDNITIEQVGLFESDMKGPCPSGFHVPLKTEWEAIVSVLTTTLSLANDKSTVKTYLKMPDSGNRNTESTVKNQGTYGYYWAAQSSSNLSAYILCVKDSNANPGGLYVSTMSKPAGCSIRALKNEPVKPKSSWTTLYDGSSVAAGAGIFWNQTDGLISLSGNGTTWYTIQDKNLGATTVYNNGDTITNANAGTYFQWGNDYGFPYLGTISLSHTKVDATDYGPQNYYDDSHWIYIDQYHQEGWDTSNNSNLRGGVSQGEWSTGHIDTVISSDGPSYEAGNNIAIGDLPIYNQVEESQAMGPCDSGFKVPTSTEWANLINAGITLGAWTASGATDFITYLHIPACHRLKFDGAIDSSSYYWSCIQYTNSYQAYNLDLLNMNAADISSRCSGFPIRAFARTPVTPTSSWTTVYAGTGSAGIFYNSTDGIISISADGTDWITIQDKNVGATTVYNYGDTMSEANCGKLFQWGNNYGFPYEGVSSTSSTSVDASGYGPGNYFSGSTFIVKNGTTNWDSSANNNLWGGVSGGTMIIDVPTGETAPTIYAKVAVQSYRPSSPTTGMLFYRTDASTLYVYDGTNWRPI